MDYLMILFDVTTRSQILAWKISDNYSDSYMCVMGSESIHVGNGWLAFSSIKATVYEGCILHTRGSSDHRSIRTHW